MHKKTCAAAGEGEIFISLLDSRKYERDTVCPVFLSQTRWFMRLQYFRWPVVHVEHFFSSHVFTNYQFTFTLSVHTHTYLVALKNSLISCEWSALVFFNLRKCVPKHCFKMKGAFFWYGRRECLLCPVMEIPLLIISPHTSPQLVWN